MEKNIKTQKTILEWNAKQILKQVEINFEQGRGENQFILRNKYACTSVFFKLLENNEKDIVIKSGIKTLRILK